MRHKTIKEKTTEVKGTHKYSTKSLSAIFSLESFSLTDLSIKEGSVPKAFKVEGKPSLLIVNNEDEFDRECKELKQVYAVVVKDGAEEGC